MPTYEYRCDNDHTFEAFQPMADDALESCEVCGAPAQRVLSAPAVHFKGSGFYTTDYARKGKKESDSDGGGESKGGDGKGGEGKTSESTGDSASSNGSGGSKSESKAGSASED